MSKTLAKFLEEEYDKFRGHVASRWAIDKGYLDQFDSELKPLHKRFLSVACAATVAGNRAKRNEYVEGAIEAGHLCMVLALKGLENSSCVLLRQSIELILKHIYFSKHPVEYEWVTSHEGYRDLTFQKVLDYLLITPEHEGIESDNYVRDRLNNWFGQLSRYVHVHSGPFIGYTRIGSGYIPNREMLKKLNERTREIWPLLTAMLIAYFPKRYFASSALEKKLMRNSLPKEIKRRIDKYLYRMP
jgi:hypothetical protein